jgi:hypothetical protein
MTFLEKEDISGKAHSASANPIAQLLFVVG